MKTTHQTRVSESKRKKWYPIEGRFNIAGVGLCDYQLICGSLKPGTVLRLVGEPSNPHYDKTIAIYYRDIKLGYVPRYTIQQSELWNCHNKGYKCIAVLTAHNKNNPTWSMFTVQAMGTECKSDFNTSDSVFFS